MSYHILSIDQPDCTLTCSKGQLIMSYDHGENRIPMEDVGAIIISSFKCSITNHFLIEACRQRIGLVICDAHKPAAIVLPTDRVTDTQTIRNLAKMSATFKQRLWKKTVDAKCDNQAILASQWAPTHPLCRELATQASTLSEHKEAICAKLFWAIFGNAVAQSKFKRGRYEEGYNSLFNYGYAILLSSTLQQLYAHGLDPIFGIFHQTREHATPLAYDLMEPFRPAFDANVARWIQLQRATGWQEEDIMQISTVYRSHIIKTLSAQVSYEGLEMPLRSALQASIASFRRAITSKQVSPYKAWKISAIKWDG
ncbi:MAG: type II CRISPR-associated endonuclease Cas1 [Akkermansia sp.]